MYRFSFDTAIAAVYLGNVQLCWCRCMHRMSKPCQRQSRRWSRLALKRQVSQSCAARPSSTLGALLIAERWQARRCVEATASQNVACLAIAHEHVSGAYTSGPAYLAATLKQSGFASVRVLHCVQHVPQAASRGANCGQPTGNAAPASHAGSKHLTSVIIWWPHALRAAAAGAAAAGWRPCWRALCAASTRQ